MERAIVLDIWGYNFSSDALISRVTALIGDEEEEVTSIKTLELMWICLGWCCSARVPYFSGSTRVQLWMKLSSHPPVLGSYTLGDSALGSSCEVCGAGWPAESIAISWPQWLIPGQTYDWVIAIRAKCEFCWVAGKGTDGRLELLQPSCHPAARAAWEWSQ